MGGSAHIYVGQRLCVINQRHPSRYGQNQSVYIYNGNKDVFIMKHSIEQARRLTKKTTRWRAPLLSARAPLLSAVAGITSSYALVYLINQGIVPADVVRIFSYGLIAVSLPIAAGKMLDYLKIEQPNTESNRLDLYLEQIRRLSAESSGIPEERIDTIIDEVASKASSRLTDLIDEELDNRYGAAREKIKKVVYLETSVKENTERLNQEVRALLRRGNLNLVIGILVTIFAVITLVYNAILAETVQGGLPEIFRAYLPRLSIVVFVQLFGFFFLRLYRVSLSDIKYFQNEITNIQQRWLALKYAIINDDKESAKIVIDKLSATERNFIIKKGETTHDLERLRMDQNDVKELLSSMKSLFQGKGPNA